MAAPLNFILNNRDVSPTHRASAAGPLNRYEYILNGALDQTSVDLDKRFQQSSEDLDAGLPQLQTEINDPDSHGSKRNKSNQTPSPFLVREDRFHARSAAAPSQIGHDLREFNIFKELLGYPELIHEITSQFELDDLINLYSISRDFHELVNGHFTAMIVAQAQVRAPESAKVFAFKCYRSLCIFDPMRRQNEERKERIRDVPGFRWLRMILHRENVVDEIIKSLAMEGHRLPRPTSRVIKQIWFLMDLPDSKRRVGVAHNPELWVDIDLYLAFMFFMKLDMRFTDPVDGNREVGLRKLMMAQRSLVVLDRVLKRKQLRDQYDLLRMYAEWRVVPTQNAPRTEVFGVPWRELGRLQCEGWKPGSQRLLRPDEVIIREAVRRDLNFEKHLIGMPISFISISLIKLMLPSLRPRTLGEH